MRPKVMRARSWVLSEDVRNLDGWRKLSIEFERSEKKVGTSSGNEKKAMKGQRYKSCERWMVATWFDLSPSTTPPLMKTKAPNVMRSEMWGINWRIIVGRRVMAVQTIERGVRTKSSRPAACRGGSCRCSDFTSSPTSFRYSSVDDA